MVQWIFKILELLLRFLRAEREHWARSPGAIRFLDLIFGRFPANCFMLLPERPEISNPLARQITHDYQRFKSGLPKQLEDYVLENYAIDLASEYGGIKIKNPFGKASGQLSLALHQVQKDAQAGLGFVVLKTVIAQNREGVQSMQQWAIPETRMKVEQIRGASGRVGWTVTWKGRGWFQSFAAYLDFFGKALEAASAARMLVIPSCKFHLPGPDETRWRVDEYQFTTQALLEVWRAQQERDSAMPLEKDFSPTLAGSSLATQKTKIREWLTVVPRLIRQGAGAHSLRIGLKIFNAMFDDQFQLEMLNIAGCPGPDRADFLVYANRLFDPHKSFAGKTGVACGGPDLSERNLRVLQVWRRGPRSAEIASLPVSATGDISSGKMAVEYLMQGCSSFQMHTFFQLPDSEYVMTGGHKTERALHRLYFHPDDGFVPWICHLQQMLKWKERMNIGQMAEWFAREGR
ncbi:MAG TPA: hypothetical protein VGL91_16640 [Acidobacteriota bacterium]|jgi:hypothetical protein